MSKRCLSRILHPFDGAARSARRTLVACALIVVACLAPAVAALSFLFRGAERTGAKAPAPMFLLGFVALVLARSGGLVPPAVAVMLADASQWCLLIAVTALGAKTSVRGLLTPGWRPLAALILQSLLLAAFALAGVLLLG